MDVLVHLGGPLFGINLVFDDELLELLTCFINPIGLGLGRFQP